MKTEHFCNFTHDHMHLTLQCMFPDLVMGRDYRCYHEIGEDGEQCSLPKIGLWKSTSVPQPDDKDVHTFFHENEAEIRAQHIRFFRDIALAATDGKASIPGDAPKSVRVNAGAWQEFRQQLRDVTEQPGFPLAIEWPESPLATVAPAATEIGGAEAMTK
ncbi:phage tail assembly chaperone [Burkholderia ubonensis]|uniref:XkdW family protein n=1 Tax=Burkholderia ubonensis TaxID=101571 RepID=UPI0009B2F513|nr:phage tail assembly chaperone [Burkholderia ubonensis]